MGCWMRFVNEAVSVREVPLNGSGDYLAMGWADCLIPLPAEDPRVSAGQTWEVHPIFRERPQIPEIPRSSSRYPKWKA